VVDDDMRVAVERALAQTAGRASLRRRNAAGSGDSGSGSGGGDVRVVASAQAPATL
jgi:hypothetical protein